MPDASEFQTAEAATLKPRDAKVVRTRGTDSRLAFAERREHAGVHIDYCGEYGSQEVYLFFTTTKADNIEEQKQNIK